jgi:hypothetical protein
MVEIAGSVARKGKPGTVTMREVIELRGGEQRPQSELEKRARKLLEASRGCRCPFRNLRFLGRRTGVSTTPTRNRNWLSNGIRGAITASSMPSRLIGCAIGRQRFMGGESSDSPGMTWLSAPHLVVETIRQLLSLSLAELPVPRARSDVYVRSNPGYGGWHLVPRAGRDVYVRFNPGYAGGGRGRGGRRRLGRG